MNLPATIGTGEKVTTPLNISVTAGTLGGWTIDVTMDPNYVTIASDSDMTPGNVPSSFTSVSHLCTAGSPPCDPPPGMQVARITGITFSSSVFGSFILANLSFTGVAQSQCGTTIKVVAKQMIDSTLGSPLAFSPMPADLNIKLDGLQSCDDTIAPSSPTELTVL